MTPRNAAHQAPLSSVISQNLLKFMSIKSVMLSNHLILCYLLLLLPSIFLSTRVFSNELALCIRWPRYFMHRQSIFCICISVDKWSSFFFFSRNVPPTTFVSFAQSGILLPGPLARLLGALFLITQSIPLPCATVIGISLSWIP